jgi:dynamin 1-like protein
LQCVQLIYEELRRVVVEIEMQELTRFQNLKKKIVETMNGLLTRQLGPCNQMVRNLI